MRKLIVLIASCLLSSAAAQAQNTNTSPQTTEKSIPAEEAGYVTVKEGKPIIIMKGMAVTAIVENIVLSDGSMITPKAVYVFPDGGSQQLKENDKVALTGKLEKK